MREICERIMRQLVLPRGRQRELTQWNSWSYQKLRSNDVIVVEYMVSVNHSYMVSGRPSNPERTPSESSRAGANGRTMAPSLVYDATTCRD